MLLVRCHPGSGAEKSANRPLQQSAHRAMLRFSSQMRERKP